MSVIGKLASSLVRRDEVPNQELAKQLVKKKDKAAIKELLDNMDNKNKNIQSDCIKVLYEIAELEPSMIVPHAKRFVDLFEHKNNRNIWGAMHALDSITLKDPKFIYSNLPKIITAAEKGSVITKDHTVNILIRLSSIKQYAQNAFTLLIEMLKDCATNQLAMYAERSMPVIDEKNKAIFIKTLRSRFDDIEKDSQRKRVERVIKKADTMGTAK